MAETVRFEVKGLRELGLELKKLGTEMSQKIARSATAAGAKVIKDIAVRKAPVAPPNVTPKIPYQNLKKSIYVRRSRKTRLTSEHVITVRSKGAKVVGKPYQVGIMQEYGTVHHGPQAFMRPALAEGQMKAIDAVKKRIADRIKKANKGK